MGDEHDRRVERHQVLLEPLQRLDVEMVGRLVQKQQVRIARQRPSERGARQLPAGERAQRAVQIGVVAEPQAPYVVTTRDERPRHVELGLVDGLDVLREVLPRRGRIVGIEEHDHASLLHGPPPRSRPGVAR